MGIVTKSADLVLDRPTPTFFLDYDGTLHRGRGAPAATGAGRKGASVLNDF
jgi:trehalose-6-phosphatase